MNNDDKSDYEKLRESFDTITAGMLSTEPRTFFRGERGIDDTNPGPTIRRLQEGGTWSKSENTYDVVAQRDELKLEVERLRMENKKLSDLAVKATESLHALLLRET